MFHLRTEQRAAFLILFFVLLALPARAEEPATGALPKTPAKKAPVAATAKAEAAAGSSLTVARDPVTGALRPLTPEEARQLLGPRSLFAAEPQVVTLPDGTRMMTARPGSGQPLRGPEESGRNPYERMRPRSGRSTSVSRGRARSRAGPSRIGRSRSLWHAARFCRSFSSRLWPRDLYSRARRSSSSTPIRPERASTIPLRSRPSAATRARPSAQQRLNVFQQAGAIWGGLLTSNVTIRVSASFTPLACSATIRHPRLDLREYGLLRFRRSPCRGNVVRQGAREQIRGFGPRHHDGRHDGAFQQLHRPDGLPDGSLVLSRPRQPRRVEREFLVGRRARVCPRTRVLHGRGFDGRLPRYHVIAADAIAGHLRPLHLRRHARPDVGQAHGRAARDVRCQYREPNVVRHGGECVRGLVSRQEAAPARDRSRGRGRHLLRRHVPLRPRALESGRNGAARRGHGSFGFRWTVDHGCLQPDHVKCLRQDRAHRPRNVQFHDQGQERPERGRDRRGHRGQRHRGLWTRSVRAARTPRSRFRPFSSP